MQTSDSRDLARRFTDAWDEGDLNALDELLAEDFVDHDPVPGQDAGREGYKQVTSAFFAAFPDLRVRNEDVIAEGDKAVLRWTARGTHQGELMGISATGRTVTLKGIDVIRVAEGRIAERWGEFDALGMLQQLGAFPPSEPAE